MNHEEYLEEAYKEAIKAYNSNEVPVGCVIVKDDKIIARTHNLTNANHDPLAHAELLGLKQLQEYNNLTFYITCEPCIMCLGILNRINAKIFYGCKNSIFGGITIMNIPSDSVYLDEPKCFQILQKFYCRENEHAPEDKRKRKDNRSSKQYFTVRTINTDYQVSQ